MPPTRQAKPPAPTRESVWFVVLWCAGALTKTCTYFWNEGRLVTQRVLLPSGFYEDDWYFYDESGSPYGFNFTNSNNESGIRYFVRNLQGDIIESGSSTSFGASHKYDAWGAVTETVLGSSTNAANFQYGYIFGYRGYQYDKETGLYYCQSRYYNSRIGRFVSADKYFDAEYSETPLTSNVWAYAENNPVNLGDHDGESATAIILGLIAVGALLTAGGCAAQSKEPPPAKNTTTAATTNAPKATTTSPPKTSKHKNPTKTSAKGVKFINNLEKFMAEAYKPLPKEYYWTIGYGHVIYEKDSKGNPRKDVKIDGKYYTKISEAQASKLLANDLKEKYKYEYNFNAFIKKKKINLNQAQYDACIADCFQKGQNIWTQDRTITKYLEKKKFNNYDKCLTAFLAGTKEQGLKNRRTKQAKLFFYGTY